MLCRGRSSPAGRPGTTPRSGAARTAEPGAQFRGTANLTGVSASVPPATLKVLWTFDAGEVVDSSAAIANGVVYVGGGDGDLFALDLASGKQIWKYTTGNLIGESSPAVGADAVYIGDLGGVLHAVNLRDGKPLWTFKTLTEIKSSPVLVNDMVLIGSYDGHLYGLDAQAPAASGGRRRRRARCMRRPRCRTDSRSSPAATRSSGRSA